MTFADRLREARERMFGDEFGACFAAARAMGVSETSYNNHEQGWRFPRPERLLLYSEFFGVSIDYLMTGQVWSAPYREDA